MKIINYVLLGVLAIIAISCAQDIFSSNQTEEPRKAYQGKTALEILNPTAEERRIRTIERDLKELEYRVRELGFMQSGTEFLPHDTWLTVTLEQSYQNTDYVLLVTSNHADVTLLVGQKLTSTTFRAKCGGAGNAEFSWLTIGL